MRLFELLGGWVESVDDSTAKMLLDRHSQHHAWRASQWWDRLPVVASIDRETLVTPASPGLEAACVLLARTSEPVDRLAGVYRVLVPRLLVSYRAHRVAASPASDAPVIRTLEHVTKDQADDWLEGEALVQRLMVTSAQVSDVALIVSRLETTLLS
ncbi:MAG: hypothetical protein M3R71_04530 [Actinomycetota bacterium]|nr:hypothetical protein [Actinomycetota bacterium]